MEKVKRVVLDWVEIIAVALVIAFIIENYIFGFAVVKGQSMYPTLQDSDRLMVFHFPYQWIQPKKGDIIIFKPPIPPTHQTGKEMFIKRVIAIENDHFFIKEGKVYINGELIEENYILQENYVERDYPHLEGRVPEGMYFVLGDNRNDSNDSRTFGYISKEYIKGKVAFKIWPLKEVKAFLNNLCLNKFIY